MKVYKKGKAPVRSVENEMKVAKIAAEAADNMPPIEMVLIPFLLLLSSSSPLRLPF